MNKQEFFRKYLIKQKENLLKSIDKAKDARDNAPSATESHSDTRRSQAEKLVLALEEQLKDLNMYEKQTDILPLRYFETQMGSGTKSFLLVPKGLGGVEMNGTRLLSEDTPLGLLLADKKEADIFEFNEQMIKVLRVE